MNMEQRFLDWIHHQNKPGTDQKYAEDTIEQYVGALKFKKFISVLGSSFFEMTSIKEVMVADEKVHHIPGFDKISCVANGNYGAAIKKYKEFLEDSFDDETVPDDAAGEWEDQQGHFNGWIYELNPQKHNVLTEPHNWIWFGAPGTGKSFGINKIACVRRNLHGGIVYNPVHAKQMSGKFEDIRSHGIFSRYERVTFYPTYSYAQFVGTYKPVMKMAGGKEEISYKFVPGPFLRVLVESLNMLYDDNHINNNWLLIIEEINRANAAAVFGDVFQLLDRDETGASEYSVNASEDVKKYLNENVRHPVARHFLNLNLDNKGNVTECQIRIPPNMYIWATMNSADQGVFPMDTAFKRRWEFEYVGIDKEEDGCDKWKLAGKFSYNWNEVRKLINNILKEHDVNEDKLLGPFFVKAPMDRLGSFSPIPQKTFASKVLMYLWEDAGRMFRRNLFGNIKTFSELLEKWDAIGIDVFLMDTKATKFCEKFKQEHGLPGNSGGNPDETATGSPMPEVTKSESTTAQP